MEDKTEEEARMSAEIARRVIKYNLWVVLLALAVEVACVIFMDEKSLIAIISAAIGAIIQALLQERQQVINFFYGSSMGSKTKERKLKNIKDV